jgi:N-acetyl-anhydromuramyl-L-alanine amidase AmpD
LNQHSIGVEIASEGALTKDAQGQLRAFDGKVVFRDGYIDNQVLWRGYRYFDCYEPAQIDSLYPLVKMLCEKFNIPKKCIDQKESTTFNEKFFDHKGILGHCNVRSDKSDPHPKFNYSFLQRYLDGEALGEHIPIPE